MGSLTHIVANATHQTARKKNTKNRKIRNVTSRKQRNMLKKKEICHQTENNVKKQRNMSKTHKKKLSRKQRRM